MAVVGLKSYILDNNLKSALLLAGFPVLLLVFVYGLTLLLMGLGVLPTTGGLGGDLGQGARYMIAGAPLAFGAALVWFFIAYWSQGWMIALTTGAVGVTRKEQPDFYNLLENLCISRGLATPSLRIVESQALNAYTTGVTEKQYSITVTRGLLDALDRDELEAVLGHELTHIINRDTRLMVICAVFAGIITFVAEMLWRGVRFTSLGERRSSNRKGSGLLIVIGLALVAIGYVLAIALRFALSRKREFLADAGSVELTKNPDAMIRALRKIAGRAEFQAPNQLKAMMFESRLTGLGAWMETHPPIETRIAALVKYAGGRVETAVPVS